MILTISNIKMTTTEDLIEYLGKWYADKESEKLWINEYKKLESTMFNGFQRLAERNYPVVYQLQKDLIIQELDNRGVNTFEGD